MPFPSSGDILNPGIEPTSRALAGGFFTTEPSGKTMCTTTNWTILKEMRTPDHLTSLM